jgi:hypothetical protein
MRSGIAHAHGTAHYKKGRKKKKIEEARGAACVVRANGTRSLFAPLVSLV